MPGGLIQITAYGDQDLYLSGNPEITFFKSVYRRHTNFAVETLVQVFDKEATEFNKTYNAIISRNGDLIQQMYLEINLPTLYDDVETVSTATYWTYGIGHAIIKRVEIDIGGQIIDRQYGDWMNIWSELSTTAGKRAGFDDMVGNASIYDGQIGLPANRDYKLYVPLQFWFNKCPGLALPLAALQFHELKLTVELRSINDLFITGYNDGTSIGLQSDKNTGFEMKLYVNYIYLDNEERSRFVNGIHEYLIEQVQYVGEHFVAGNNSGNNFGPPSSITYKLNYTYPVKSIYWYHINETHNSQNITYSADGCGNSWFNFAFTNVIADLANVQSLDDTFSSAKIQFNSTDRFTERTAEYFRKVVPYERHSNMPRCGQPNLTLDGLYKYHSQYIYMYSFSLSPEDFQPSGNCMFSRLDNATLNIYYDKAKNSSCDNRILKVYALNYNILRIISGMAGLAYSS